MELVWSSHARDLLADILVTIATELSPEDALCWRQKIDDAISPLVDHPNLGKALSADCFSAPVSNLKGLRQIVCEPYRIVYEVTAVACYILSVRHGRMLLRSNDAEWN